MTDNLAILDEPAPCETCRHAAHCRTTWEACLAFLEYAEDKRWDLIPKQPRRWMSGDRHPTDADAMRAGIVSKPDSG